MIADTKSLRKRSVMVREMLMLALAPGKAVSQVMKIG